MKIRPEHFATLRKAITAFIADHQEACQRHKAAHNPKRYRWDVFYRTRINGQSSSHWVGDNLYPYLNDTHIDTALRRIVT